MRFAPPAIVGMVSVLLLAACGQSVVVDAVSEAPPYTGPLYVEVTASPSDKKADRSGAAGQVVDCDAPLTGSSEREPYEGGPMSRSPADALRHELSEYVTRGARTGLREARREADRVLYVYELDRRVKQAMIVHRGKGIGGDTGWYVESWARCDWSELPPALADGLGLEVWTDEFGTRIPTSRVVSSAGAEHCDWQEMTFLSIDGGDLDEGQSYVGQPDPSLYPDYFTVAYESSTALPTDAQDTGYERDGRHLWTAADRSRAFVGTPESVAVWPRTVQPLGCA